MTRENRTTEQLTAEFEHRREIRNLMGKYITSLMLNRDRDLFQQFWSQEKDDVCLGLNDGWYVGRPAVSGYFDALGKRLELIASLLQKKFPDQLGGKTPEEIYGIGPYEGKPVTNPYVVVAEDERTARGTWMVQGSTTDVDVYGPVSYWTWGVYACDFVYEAGGWKIWHMQYLEDIHHIMAQNWAEPEAPPPELPEFAPMKEFHMPPFTVEKANHSLYTPEREFQPWPELPKPYGTFSADQSYGI